MKSVLILTQYFYLDIASTGQVLTQLAEDLVQNGYEVKVITGQPNYQRIKEKAKKFEIYNGIKIWRLNYLRFNKNSKIGRILGYLSFPFLVLLKIFFIGNYETILIVSNPPILPYIGYITKKFKHVNFVFLLHDLYPDVAIKIGVISNNSLMSKLMNYINKKVFESADNIVVLGRDAKELLIKKGVSPQKIKIITNWADRNKLDITVGKNIKAELNIKDKFVVLYTGNIGLFYELENIVYSMKHFEDKNIYLIFIGEGGKKKFLQKIVLEENIKNVLFLPYQDENEYGDILRSADVLLVSLANNMEGVSVPSKTYSYLAAGRPIVAVMSKDTEIGQLIEENNCGIRVDPGNKEAFIKAIVELYNDGKLREKYGNNARNLFEAKYERRLVTSKFFDIL